MILKDDFTGSFEGFIVSRKGAKVQRKHQEFFEEFRCFD
jgi:hypothetical protein